MRFNVSENTYAICYYTLLKLIIYVINAVQQGLNLLTNNELQQRSLQQHP